MNLLFVCTGNTCRSVMAEGIFNAIIKNKSIDIKASSAGISAIPGSVATENAVKMLKTRLGVNFHNREAVQLTLVHMGESSIILTMTDYIANILKRNFPQFNDKIYSLKGFIGELGELGDIVDPYGGNIFIYEETFNILIEKIDLIINKLQEYN